MLYGPRCGGHLVLGDFRFDAALVIFPRWIVELTFEART
jgi:hypothetical protein